MEITMAVFFIFIQNISPLQGAPLGLNLWGTFWAKWPKTASKLQWAKQWGGHSGTIQFFG